MKPPNSIISNIILALLPLMLALLLSGVLFAVNIAASSVVGWLLHLTLGSNIIESSTFLGLLGLCAFPYSFIFIPISLFLMLNNKMNNPETNQKKIFCATFRKKILWQAIIGIILWILLLVTGAYIA
jgi:hypothetical protein